MTELISVDKAQEKITNNIIKVKGLAVKAGVSRNNVLYTSEWIQAYSTKLVNTPIYIEHVTATNAIGKVTNVEVTNEGLFYEGEIYDDNVGKQIQKGLISNVSIGYDYRKSDEVIRDGAFYRPNPYNAELSLVACPGIPDASIAIESIEGVCHACESADGNLVIQEDPKDKRIKELEDAYSKIVKANEELKNNQANRINEAKKEGIKEVVTEIEKIVPHEYISNRWNLGSKRFLQDVRKVAYKAKESI